MRLASGGSQPPLFQPPPDQQPAASPQVLLQRSGSMPLTQIGGAAPQLTVLSPINIQARLYLVLLHLSCALKTNGLDSLVHRFRLRFLPAIKHECLRHTLP